MVLRYLGTFLPKVGTYRRWTRCQLFSGASQTLTPYLETDATQLPRLRLSFHRGDLSLITSMDMDLEEVIAAQLETIYEYMLRLLSCCSRIRFATRYLPREGIYIYTYININRFSTLLETFNLSIDMSMNFTSVILCTLLYFYYVWCVPWLFADHHRLYLIRHRSSVQWIPIDERCNIDGGEHQAHPIKQAFSCEVGA